MESEINQNSNYVARIMNSIQDYAEEQDKKHKLLMSLGEKVKLLLEHSNNSTKKIKELEKNLGDEFLRLIKEGELEKANDIFNKKIYLSVSIHELIPSSVIRVLPDSKEHREITDMEIIDTAQVLAQYSNIFLDELLESTTLVNLGLVFHALKNSNDYLESLRFTYVYIFKDNKNFSIEDQIDDDILEDFSFEEENNIDTEDIVNCFAYLSYISRDTIKNGIDKMDKYKLEHLMYILNIDDDRYLHIRITLYKYFRGINERSEEFFKIARDLYSEYLRIKRIEILTYIK